MVIEKLATCDESGIGQLLGEHFAHPSGWLWPKTDLIHWVDVLDRFDDLMAGIVRSYDIINIQNGELKPGERALLLSILDFEKQLLENCSGRGFYSSYDVRRSGRRFVVTALLDPVRSFDLL